MKRCVFLWLFFLFAFLTIDAQTPETVSELVPVPEKTGKFSRHAVLNYKLKFDARADAIKLPNGNQAIAVTIRIDYEDLVFEQVTDKWAARISVYGRITSEDKVVDGFFEETMDVRESTVVLTNLSNNAVTLKKVFEINEGKYQVGIIVKDLTNGWRNVKLIKLRVPSAAAQNTNK